MIYSRLRLLALAVLPAFGIFFSSKLLLDSYTYSKFQNYIQPDILRGFGFLLAGLSFIFLRHAIREIPKGFSHNLGKEAKVSEILTKLLLIIFIPGVSLLFGISALQDSVVVGKNRVTYYGADARGMGLVMIFVSAYSLFALRKDIKNVAILMLQGLGLFDNPQPETKVLPVQEKKMEKQRRPSVKQEKQPNSRRRKKRINR